MNAKAISSAFLLAFASINLLSAQSPQLLPPVFRTTGAKEAKGKLPEKLKEPPKILEEKKLTEASSFDYFAQAPSPYGEVRSGFNPQMMGDFLGKFARQNVTVFGTLTTSTTVFNTPPTGPLVTLPAVTTQISQQRTVLVYVPGAGAFKVADNASPRPQDRIFGTYTYYAGIRSPGDSQQPGTQVQTSQTTTTDAFGNIVTTNTTATFNSPANQRLNLNREVVGFEKTFLGGFASVSVRLPVMQQTSDNNQLITQQVGDLTVVGKYALLLDRLTGNVVSGGLAITAPTGPSVTTIDGTIHSTLFQPWFGYIWNFDRFYFQGFHSVVVPTDSRDVIIGFNDVGLNWWLFARDQPTGGINFIVPTIEAHIATPLNNRGANSAIFVFDQVVMTAGVHIGIGRFSTLSLGAGTPVTGPNLYSVQGFAQYNWRF